MRRESWMVVTCACFLFLGERLVGIFHRRLVIHRLYSRSNTINDFRNFETPFREKDWIRDSFIGKKKNPHKTRDKTHIINYHIIKLRNRRKESLKITIDFERSSQIQMENSSIHILFLSLESRSIDRYRIPKTITAAIFHRAAQLDFLDY